MTRSLSTLLVLLFPLGALAFDGGDGSSGSPFQISTCVQLDSIRDTTDYGTLNFLLTDDIDCSGFGPFVTLWAPYQATFDGGGHTIRGLDIATGNSTTLFWDLTSSSIVQNLSIEDATLVVPFNSSTNAGILAGEAKGTIQDVAVSGTITIARPGQLGGMIGYLNGGTATRVHADVDLIVNGEFGFTVGGLVGLTNSNAVMSIASASGNVSYVGGDSTFVWLGGLVGRMLRTTCNECSATGNVSAVGSDAASAGGLVGRTQSQFPGSVLNNSYSQSNVSIPSTSTGVVGGLVGDGSDLTITHAYASGELSGPSGISGMVGSITSSVTLNQVLAAPLNGLSATGYGIAPTFPSGSTAVFGNYTGSAAPCSGTISTSCVNSPAVIFAYYTSTSDPLNQWDFASVWEEVPGDFPQLRNSVAPDPPVIVCEVGTPFDWDDDGEDDGCRGTNVTVAPSATIPAGTQVGDNVTILDSVTLGSGNVLHNGVVLAPRVTLGDDNTLFASVLLGRGASIGDRNEVAANTVFGRQASAADDNVLGGLLGYAAAVGSHVDLPDLTLGNLASIGNAATAAGQIDCVGPLILARSTQVAVNPAHSLSCTGRVVVGPETILESTVLGSNVRIRKLSLLVATSTIGDDVRIGRNVQLGSGVSVDPDARIGADVDLCDTSSAFDGNIPRDFVDPACP